MSALLNGPFGIKIISIQHTTAKINLSNELFKEGTPKIFRFGATPQTQSYMINSSLGLL